MIVGDVFLVLARPPSDRMVVDDGFDPANVAVFAL